MTNSNSKGKRGEREFANLLKDNGYFARRSQQYQGTENSADITSELPFHFEVKRVEKLNLSKAMIQAISDSDDNLPVVAHRKNREDWLITMQFKDWIKLVKQVYRGIIMNIGSALYVDVPINTRGKKLEKRPPY